MGQTDPFVGAWTNLSGYSDGAIHRIVVTSDSSGETIHGYGSCSGYPTGECDWGAVPLSVVPAAVAPGQPVSKTMYGLSQWTLNGRTYTSALRLDGPRLILDTYDGDIARTTEIMRLGPPTPAQMLPLDNTTFNVFPRTTVFTWQGNSEAANYGIEIDVYSMCQNNAWCTDVGGPTFGTETLTAPTYTFNFVGAQPGRWRVWSIDANGVKSPKSEWWNFTYTQ